MHLQRCSVTACGFKILPSIPPCRASALSNNLCIRLPGKTGKTSSNWEYTSKQLYWDSVTSGHLTTFNTGWYQQEESGESQLLSWLKSHNVGYFWRCWFCPVCGSTFFLCVPPQGLQLCIDLCTYAGRQQFT